MINTKSFAAILSCLVIILILDLDCQLYRGNRPPSNFFSGKTQFTHDSDIHFNHKASRIGVFENYHFPETDIKKVIFFSDESLMNFNQRSFVDHNLVSKSVSRQGDSSFYNSIYNNSSSVKPDVSKGTKLSSQCVSTHKEGTFILNVKNFGARGDGKSDDTEIIQKAIDKVAKVGGIVFIPEGTYMVDAVSSLLLKSNITFNMAEGAVLRAIPNNRKTYNIIRIEKSSNVNVVGGKLQGERYQHQGVTGEWGIGLEISASKNIVIERVSSIDNWGDGFYVGDGSSNVIFCSVTADNNRRQGISITSADGVRIMDSIFKNTNGTLPMDGIDIEPNEGDVVNHVQILNSQFINNKGSGIELTVPDRYQGSAFIKDVIVDSNIVTNNGEIGSNTAGIKISRQSGQKITNNRVKNNIQDGISFVSESIENIVRGNIVTGNGNDIDKKNGYGIVLNDKSSSNIVINNIVEGNKNKNIFDHSGKNIVNSNRP